MSKKSNDGGPRLPRPKRSVSAPPPLSEELIAKLQGAVIAAQRKRNPQPTAVNDPVGPVHDDAAGASHGED